MVDPKYIDYWRRAIADQNADHQRQASQAWQEVTQIADLLRSHFGATQIIVFGSLVKDRFHDTSDIDIAVAGIPPERYFEAVGAANRYSDRWVDLKPLEALEPRFLERIMATGVLLDDQFQTFDPQTT
jgi:uncharacterized protein